MPDTMTKAWLVCDHENDLGCMIVDAETGGKAKWRTKGDLWDDSETRYPLLTARRRRDLDGLAYDQARRIVWPCKQDPCPGCSCCEAGICGGDDDD